MFKAHIFGDCFRNKFLPEPIAFLLESFITHAQDGSICGELNDLAAIYQSGIIVMVQVVKFGIDGIEMSKLMPEHPAEMLIIFVRQEVLPDKNGISFIAMNVFHDGCFRLFHMIASSLNQ
jgi:hypothetical protein